MLKGARVSASQDEHPRPEMLVFTQTTHTACASAVVLASHPNLALTSAPTGYRVWMTIVLWR
eukprot:20719-Eustigmatos_ZCMA.PRE.1